jgi:DNA repair exonuclease SbcCD ATPase subunit
MSEKDQKFLTEVDKMIMKLDEIIIAIKGEEGVINYKNVKDGFERLRFEINDELKTVETLLMERDKILTSTQPKEIFERKKLEGKLESKLEQIEEMMKNLNIELKAQKNKTGKYGDFTQKEKYVGLIEQKYQLFRSKLDGMEIDEKQIEENKDSMEQLEEILANEEGRTAKEERELYEEEKAKMQEWKEELARQDEDLDEISGVVKELKEQSKLAGENIEKTHKQVKKVTKSTVQTTKRVNQQNKKLKDLISKLRSGDKLCVDIILILVGLGLVAVLYNIISSQV